MKNYGNRKYSESLQKTLVVLNNQDLRVKDLKIGSCQVLYIGKNSKLTIPWSEFKIAKDGSIEPYDKNCYVTIDYELDMTIIKSWDIS